MIKGAILRPLRSIIGFRSGPSSVTAANESSDVTSPSRQRLSRCLKRQPRGVVLEGVEGLLSMMKRMTMTGQVRRVSERETEDPRRGGQPLNRKLSERCALAGQQ